MSTTPIAHAGLVQESILDFLETCKGSACASYVTLWLLLLDVLKLRYCMINVTCTKRRRARESLLYHVNPKLPVKLIMEYVHDVTCKTSSAIGG